MVPTPTDILHKQKTSSANVMYHTTEEKKSLGSYLVSWAMFQDSWSISDSIFKKQLY